MRCDEKQATHKHIILPYKYILSPPLYTHTHTHTHIHTHTLTHTHVHRRSHRHGYTDSDTHTYIHTRAQTTSLLRPHCYSRASTPLCLYEVIADEKYVLGTFGNTRAVVREILLTGWGTGRRRESSGTRATSDYVPGGYSKGQKIFFKTKPS